MFSKKQRLLPQQWRRLLIALVGLPLIAWSGCAQPDLSGRLESAPADVERLREKLGQIDW
ncbi:MAG: hypothetical protein ACKO81_08460 [Planctomycetota bacterium]